MATKTLQKSLRKRVYAAFYRTRRILREGFFSYYSDTLGIDESDFRYMLSLIKTEPHSVEKMLQSLGFQALISGRYFSARAVYPHGQHHKFLLQQMRSVVFLQQVFFRKKLFQLQLCFLVGFCKKGRLPVCLAQVVKTFPFYLLTFY